MIPEYRTDDLFTPPGAGDIPSLDQLPPGTTRFIDINVYDVPAPQQEEDIAVESDHAAVPDERDAPEEQEDRPRLATVPLRVHRRRPRLRPRHTRPPRWALLVLVVCVCGSIGILLAVFWPVLAASATITIVPVSRAVSVTTQMTVLPSGTPDATKGQLAGRALPALTMSQQGAVPTTGRGHQDARAAQGKVTFYNGAPSVQTVGAGTLLTGADGVQVVTEQDAVIPAAIYPAFGQATVLAHAVQVGPAGDIKAGDIYGLCCRLNVSAVNGAFAGGTQARDYQTVTQHDLDQATTSLKTSLDQSIQAALQMQTHADETLLTPLACTTKAAPDHQPGDEAARVQVQVTESCTGLAYNTHAYQGLLAQSVGQAARTQLGDGYQPQTDMSAIMLHTTTQGKNVVLEVHVTQSYGYQFTAEQQAHMRALVAGKDKAGAISALLAVPGVQSVSLSIGNGGMVLPSDTSRIHLAFLVMLG